MDAVASQGPLPDLAELCAQPPARHCGDRHVCGCHRDVPAPLCLDCAQPRPQTGCSLRGHAKSHARLAFRPNDRGLSWDTAPRYLLRDRDKSYGPAFRHRVRAMGITEVITAPRSPWQNPHVERLIGSIRRECLDHVIILSERHLRRVLLSYFQYHHRQNPSLAQQGLPTASSRATSLRRQHCCLPGGGRSPSSL
jgi:hypothetical protein